MNILVLTFGFPSSVDNNGFLGGSFILPEVLAYSKAGAKVTILTIHSPGLPLKEVIHQNITVIRVPYFLPIQFEKIRIPNYPLYSKKHLLARIFQIPFFIAAYCFFLLIFAPKHDIIHANWTPTALLSLPFSFLFNRPIFLTFRGTDLTILPKFLNRLIIKMVDGVFKWKLGDVTKYIKLFPGNYIELPIITTIERKISNRTKKCRIQKNYHGTSFAFIGRLTDDKIQLLKGVDIIIPAVGKLTHQHQDRIKMHFHIIGDGPSQNKLKNLAKIMQVDNFITFHGHQNNVAPYLFNSDAVLGGLGLNAVVQETALSNRLIIMAKDKEFCGDIWQDKINALLYTPYDSKSLAQALNFVIENKTKSTKIAAQGAITIKEYTTGIRSGGEIYLEVFRSLIKNRKQNK